MSSKLSFKKTSKIYRKNITWSYSSLHLSSCGESIPTVASDSCSLVDRSGTWRSALVVNLPQCLVCWEFWHAFLLSTVVKSGYLWYCSLSACSNQAGGSVFWALINTAFPPAEQLLTGCFPSPSPCTPFCVTARDSCVWRSQEIRNFSQNNQWHHIFFSILMLDVSIN